MEVGIVSFMPQLLHPREKSWEDPMSSLEALENRKTLSRIAQIFLCCAACILATVSTTLSQLPKTK